MRAKDIKPDHVYAIKNNPYSVKVLEVLPSKKGINVNPYIVVKCIMSTNNDFSFGLIKYLKPTVLVDPY